MTDSGSQPVTASPAVQDPGRLAQRLMQRAHNQDGLPEIVIGVFSLFVSALMTAQLYAAKGSVLEKTLALAMVVIITPSILVLRQIIKWFRRRYLIAREGYFESRPSRARKIRIALGITGGAAVLFCFVIAAKRGMVPPDRWLLAGTGVFAGLLAALNGQSSRFAVEGLLMAVAGVAIGYSGVSLTAGLALFFGITGAMTLISGVSVLRRFLRRTAEGGS